jgi:hypothetical protein
MRTPSPRIPSIIAIAALVLVIGGIAYQQSRPTPMVEAQSPVTEPAVLTADPIPEPIKDVPAPTLPIGTEVSQKIDASSDTAMVDSLDFISRQLDPAGQQQLQDDYNAIQTALESQAVSDDPKDADSLAPVRKAIDGKTAAELSGIADQLKSKG